MGTIFSKTGQPQVDDLLGAVVLASNASHNSEYWWDSDYWFDDENSEIESHGDNIESKSRLAADRITALEAALEDERESCHSAELALTWAQAENAKLKEAVTAYANTVDVANDEIIRLDALLDEARELWGKIYGWSSFHGNCKRLNDILTKRKGGE